METPLQVVNIQGKWDLVQDYGLQVFALATLDSPLVRGSHSPLYRLRVVRSSIQGFHLSSDEPKST
jgi:hypothetical protein